MRADFTPRVDLGAEPGTGPVRERRPAYVSLLPPCNEACPAGENIQAWLAEARAGRDREAWLTLVEDNPLPGIHGRACYHPCESACNRRELGAAVSIHAVERFLGDLAAKEGWPLPAPSAASGRKVLVVGAGPAGLSAAYHLARFGHAVEIHDAAAEPGGMMRYGIPAYRLPRADLAAEVRRIEAMGVRILCNRRVADLLAEKRSGGFDAVFVGIGAGAARHIDIPTRDAARVLDAVSLLHAVGTGERPRLGRRVVVYGGGNTAMDAARTARRLGVEDTLIVYHRDRAHMSAHAFEADEAVEEGVRIKWLSAIREIVGPELAVETMELDAQGRPRPTGRIERLEADAVVLALGQDPDSAFLRAMPEVELGANGMIRTGTDMMTGHPGVFAGGDAVSRERSVTVSVGQGKRAARHIDAYLRGVRYERAPQHPVVTYSMLHLPVYSDAETRAEPRTSPEIRLGGFEEVTSALDEPQARYEAARCLSCGNCFECDQCYAACPEQAVERLGAGKGYRFLYERCTGCAVCFQICPCHAIEMQPEPTAA